MKINVKIKIQKIIFLSIDVASPVSSLFLFFQLNIKKRRYGLLIQIENNNYHLAIFNYIKGIQMIDFIKYCLLNKEQINLFNYLVFFSFKN